MAVRAPRLRGVGAAQLRYDYAERTVWIDDMGEAGQGTMWPLCQVHADRLNVPVGWTRVDRRVQLIPLSA